MVTAVASTPKHHRFSRPALITAASDDAPRRPKSREVTSRYLSLSTSTSSSSSNSTNTTSSSFTSASSVSSIRSQSPILSSRPGNVVSSIPKTQKRAVSAERRRPMAATAGVTTPSNAERMLVKSMRSLSVSFQGESYSIPVNKAKTPGGLRKCTPERRKAAVTPLRDGRENSRPRVQQQRWPGRLRAENSNIMARSLDLGVDRLKLSGSGAGLDELRKSIDEHGRNTKNSKIVVKQVKELDSLNSDAESVSSGSTASGTVSRLRGGPREIAIPARIRPVASNRVLDLASPVSNASNTTGPAKLIVAKKFQNDSAMASPKVVTGTRGLSPLPGGVRAVSPMKALASPTVALSKGMGSPLRNRVGLGNSIDDRNICSTPSMSNFVSDVRRAKLGESRIGDAHDLRLLYNRHLQLRLANARAENVLLVQQHIAERSLHSAWMTISKLRHSVKSQRIELQLLRHNVKLYTILKEQEPYLKNWGWDEFDHCNSVSGAIEALEASTIRLPVVGARADVKKVKEAISSALEMMHALSSSTGFLFNKVEHMNSLVSEVSKLSARERVLLDECKETLSTTIIPLQVMHCSLVTHVLQVQRLPTSSTKNV